MGDAAGPALERVREGVRALYHSTSEEERAQANSWLMAFVHSPEAWAVASALLREPADEVQYFGANMLFMKVRNEWHVMPEEAKAQTYAGLQQLVRQHAAASAGGAAHRLSLGLRRLCLAIAAAAAREKGAADRFLRDALTLAAEPGGAAVGIELAAAVSQEVAERGAAVEAAGDARSELRALLPQAQTPRPRSRRAPTRPSPSQVLAMLQTHAAGADAATLLAPSMRCLQVVTAWMYMRLICA